MLKLAIILALASSTAAESSIEERMLIIEENMAAIAADNAVLKADNAAMKVQLNATKADNAAMKVQLNVTSATGKLELFVDGRTSCPEGTIEVNVSKGRAMISRPHRGKTGAVFNRPFDAGEIGRTPKHSHDVDISDKGHTHAGLVKDPGHTHLNTPHSHTLPTVSTRNPQCNKNVVVKLVFYSLHGGHVLVPSLARALRLADGLVANVYGLGSRG
jgi:hypothetical protein